MSPELFNSLIQFLNQLAKEYKALQAAKAAA